MRSLTAMIGVTILVASACGTGATSATTTAATTATTVTGPPTASQPERRDLVASCGAIVLTGMPDPILPETALDDDALSALDNAGRFVGMEAMFFDDYDWSIAERSADHLVLFGRPFTDPPPGSPPYAAATFALTADGWKPSGWGQCRIEVSAEGFGNGHWVLHPDHEPDPASTQLEVLVNERACASGRPPEGRDTVPVLVADDDKITITMLIEQLQGDATCPSNPWYPVTIELGEPLGDRALFDGAGVPALLRTWPPTNATLSSFGTEE